MGKTLLDKVWDLHTVRTLPSGQDQLFVGLHLVHEVTSPRAFQMLRERGLKVRFANRTVATVDHIVPTDDQRRPFHDTLAEQMMAALEKNAAEFGILFFHPGTEDQGIVHVVGPEPGLSQPGMIIACGDSHTSTHGALGAIGYAYEYGGPTIESLPMESRLTVCNMSIEGGARFGYVCPDEVTDIDTDRIIPARYLKSVTFDGLGEAAFYDERFESDGTPKKHPLNDGRFKDASILIAGRNFGCGSSREHAPQALLRWGIQAVMGGSFAEIFAGNCAAIGVPTVTVSHKDVDRVMSLVERRPETVIHVDLDKKAVTAKGLIITLQMPETVRRSLLNGMWETIAVLLAAEGDFESTAMRIPYISRFPYEPIADAIL